MENIRAILFDFDGVMGDTTEQNYEAWSWAISKWGKIVERDVYFPMEGFKIDIIASTLLDHQGLPADLSKELIERREDWAATNHTPVLFQGNLELVDRLKQNNYRVAVVTAASRRRMDNPILAPLRTRLDALVTGEDTPLGKPNPDPYLSGANKVGAIPQNCIVVENAPAGIDAAKSAGMGCIGVTSSLTSDYLSKADIIIEDMTCCFDAICKLSSRFSR